MAAGLRGVQGTMHTSQWQEMCRSNIRHYQHYRVVGSRRGLSERQVPVVTCSTDFILERMCVVARREGDSLFLRRVLGVGQHALLTPPHSCPELRCC